MESFTKAKAKKALEKIKIKKEGMANYEKGIEKLFPKKVEKAVENEAVAKLNIRERKVEASGDQKRRGIKSKAESNSHIEHEKYPQPRWK